MIIGLCGPMQAGKDTTANYLIEKYGFEHRKFATKMRETVCALFDLKDEYYEDFKLRGIIELEIKRTHPTEGVHFVDSRITGRKFLERLGTEVGRQIYGKDFWAFLTLPVEEHYTGKKIVISDVRFVNEAERIRTLNGYNIEVVRPGADYDSGHASRMRLPEYLIDIQLPNDGYIEKLYSRIDDVLNDLAVR